MRTHFTITPGIENRLSAWNEMARRQPLEKKTSRPFVTISREFGCQAYPLAEILHKRLNESAEGEDEWIVLDRLLLEKIAAESGFLKAELEYITQVNPVLQTLVMTFLGRKHSDPFVVFTYIRKTIRYFAKAGNSIIVGRGGVSLTQDLPQAFHVRLVAPLSFKLGIIMKNLGLTEEEAKAHIEARQFERDEFTQHFTQTDLSNPYLYHLLINNEKSSLDQIADIIMEQIGKNLPA